jgi:CdiI immunity protein
MNESVSYAMEQFFGGYFHPDWDLEADEWPEIVDNFVLGEEPRQLYSLARDIDEFRSRGQEHELHAAMLKMGEARAEPDLRQFLVCPPPLTYKEWLGQVADRLRQRAAAIENGSES